MPGISICRGGCFSPPAVRPRFSRRVPRGKFKSNKCRASKNSNREPLRLEINVTQTKQTPEHRFNRELEPLFQVPINPRSSSCQNALCVAIKPPANMKNTKPLPSFMFRLKSTPALCFVGVTERFNRTMFRLEQLAKRTKSELAAERGGGVYDRSSIRKF
jgi:hypothetical protein